MKVILISGPQGSGKTTLQKAIAKALFLRQNKRVEQINFADVIYKIHNFALNVLEEHGITRDIAKDGKLLQLLGTEWGRDSIDKDIWPKTVKAKIQSLEKLGVDTVIIGDCRFENEFDFFPEALRIRLNAPEKVRKERCTQWRDNSNHPSETSLDFYEETKRFDMFFDTSVIGTEVALELVIAQLKKQCWVEKRGPVDVLEMA